MDGNKIAKLLISHNCVSFAPHNPFTYASGLKGPIYCDNRQLLSHPLARNEVILAFLKMIGEVKPQVELLAGLATAGIAHAALIADRLSLPMVYIRSKAKEHGKQNLIEGHFTQGQKTLLVEDLVNQASSMESAVVASREAGLDLIGAVSIVDYQMKTAKERFESWKIPLFALTTFEQLVEQALQQNLIDQKGRDLLFGWQQDTKNWQS